MKTCKDISGLLSEGMDRSLTWQERWAIRLHISYCRSCLRFMYQVNFLSRAAKKFKPDNKN